MNFRTTILLLVLLIAVAIVFVVAKGRQSATDQSTTTKTDTEDKGRAGQKLLGDLSTASVNKVVVTPASGDKLAFERSGTAEWRITSPVNAPADAFKVDDLVREVTELRTSGRTDLKDKGLDQPQYVLEVTDKDGKTTKINVGSRSAVGDILYVKLDGHDQADLVSASIVDQLEKPVSEYRKTKLLTTSNDKITGVTIDHDGQTLKLAKSGEKWQVVEPKQMPGDAGQISSLLSAITGLSAVKFVAEDATKDASSYGFNKPQMTISYTTTPPETQPTTKATATTQPAGETATIKFGRFEDVRKKDLYAIVSDTGPVVTVAATTLDSFKKTPLDLRDRDVVNVTPDSVSRVSISIDKAATTQPTSQPAVKKELVLERRSEVEQPEPGAPATKPASPAPAGPRPSGQSRVNTPDGEGLVQLAAFAEPATAAEPTTKPSAGPTTAPSTTTAPATTRVAAATQPAKPKTKWLITSDAKGDANDANVQALLDSLRPLRAEKYVEKFPTTQAAPAATYVVRINTRAWADEPAKNIELKITDPGNNATPVGQVGDLTFEVNRTLLDKLTADYTPSKNPSPSEMPQGFPGFPGAPGPGGGPRMPAGHPQIPLPPDDGGN